YGGHARGHGARMLHTLRGRDGPLEGTHRGVHVAGIDDARLLTGKASGNCSRTAEHITGGEEQGFTVLPFRPSGLPGTHRQGIESGSIQIAVQPARLPLGIHFGSPPSLCRPMTSLSTLTMERAASLRERSICPR